MEGIPVGEGEPGVPELEWADLGAQIEPELNKLLDALVAAGYVEEWGHSPTGSLWAITEAGHSRLAMLGRD